MTGMGYWTLYFRCINCGRPDSANPELVPSIRVSPDSKSGAFRPDPDGEREPVCRHCMTAANAMREAAGLEPHPIMPGAYEPGPENVLP